MARDTPDSRRFELQRLLQRRSLSAEALLSALSISQPTLSRTIQGMSEVFPFRLQGQRTPRYGLIKALPGGLSGRQRVYSVGADGKVSNAGELCLLSSGETFVRTEDGIGALFDGLPPSLAFAAPSGFLGRQAAQAVSETFPVPANVRDWSDDHKCAYLFAYGSNLPGNLVFGERALELAMDHWQRATPIPLARRSRAFEASISDATESGAGSSAGGEQPKFLALVEDHGSVIVKYARSGSRMADLLNLECLASACLQDADTPAAPSWILDDGGNTYLEVQRFDRVGARGRLGMISAGAFDDEHFGRRDNWPAFAARCVADRVLSPEAALRVEVLTAFSELIGNNDRHFENLSLALDGAGRISGVCPAYDVLPMVYAPVGDRDPALRPIAPRLSAVGGNLVAWRAAGAAAVSFWERAATDRSVRLSSQMRALATENAAVVGRFVEPLL